MGRKKSLLNKAYFLRYWEERLSNLALNVFAWENLPSEINPSAMEKFIMLGGYGIFFKDKQLDKYFCLPGALTGIDVYGYPTRAKPIALGKDYEEAREFIKYDFDEYTVGKDCVIIYANRTRTTALQYVSEYADKLSELDLAIKLNTMAMKHPVVVKGSQQTKESFDTLLRQYDETYYQIITDKGLDINDSLQVINFGVNAKEILDLQKEKETVLNEFFGVFGISGTVEKRERIISGEMNAMKQQMDIQQRQWLATRERACEQIKDIFGLDISVSMATRDESSIDGSVQRMKQADVIGVMDSEGAE